MRALALVCLGGAVGSGARYLLSVAAARALGPGLLPWGTWAVNVVGCFAIQLVTHALAKASLSPVAALTLTTGVLGGFTTYSAFNHQMIELARAGNVAASALYFAATVAGCLVAGFLGIVVAQSLWGR